MFVKVCVHVCMRGCTHTCMRVCMRMGMCVGGRGRAHVSVYVYVYVLLCAAQAQIAELHRSQAANQKLTMDIAQENKKLMEPLAVGNAHCQHRTRSLACCSPQEGTLPEGATAGLCMCLYVVCTWACACLCYRC